MRSAPTPTSRQIGDVRAFNRFYTRQAGLLDEHLLKSQFSLTEVRVLYELMHGERLTAAELGRGLGLDPGYLSRIVGKFSKGGFLKRRPSKSDARQSLLELTPAGRRAFAPLDRASDRAVADLLSGLSEPDRQALLAGMKRIRRVLGDDTADVPVLLRPHQPGDLGWVTHRQALLYHREYGWDETYEALVARILSEFVQNFDPKRERSWIAERGGEIVGSVFVMKKSEEVAQLRLLYVEPSARSHGIGRRLVDECIRFAYATSYERMVLWTNDVLVSARRIYEAAGFRLVEEEAHHSFGKDLVGQTFELGLRTSLSANH